MAVVQGPRESRQSETELSRAEERVQASPPGPRQSRLPHTSLRQLQAKIEADKQEVREIIKPLLETENGFMKELDMFLSQHDEAQLRRKEMLHKSWTERVSSLQRRVEERASSCSAAKAKARKSLYTQYLHQCNTKGRVFLETYDPKEYNPFALNIKKQHDYKLSKVDLKEPLYLHERGKGKRTAHSSQAGCKYKLPLSECATYQADLVRQALSHYQAPASGKPPLEDRTEDRKSSRLDNIPYYIRSTGTADGRCHQSSCWFSRS